jgi:hypothetical protein
VTERLTLILATLILAVIGLLPVAAMLGETLIADGGFSVNAYRALLSSDGQFLLLMGHSLQLSLLTAIVSTLVGVPLGVLLGKTDLPLRGAFTLLFAAPLLMPSYVLAVAWFSILGRTGLLRSILPYEWSQEIASAFFGLFGCTFVLTSAFMPIAMLLTIAFLRTVNPRLENAGKARHRLAKHPAPDNAATHGSGNWLCRRADTSSVPRRDQRPDVSAVSGLSGRDVDAIRGLLRFSRGDRRGCSSAFRVAHHCGIANRLSKAGFGAWAANSERRTGPNCAGSLAVAASRVCTGVCRGRGCIATRRSCPSIVFT